MNKDMTLIGYLYVTDVTTRFQEGIHEKDAYDIQAIYGEKLLEVVKLYGDADKLEKALFVANHE